MNLFICIFIVHSLVAVHLRGSNRGSHQVVPPCEKPRHLLRQRGHTRCGQAESLPLVWRPHGASRPQESRYSAQRALPEFAHTFLHFHVFDMMIDVFK